MLYCHPFTYFWFHFGNEIPINCSFPKGKWTCMLYFKVKCTQHEICGQTTSKNERNIYLFISWSRTRQATIVNRDFLFLFLKKNKKNLQIWWGCLRVPNRGPRPWDPPPPHDGFTRVGKYQLFPADALRFLVFVQKKILFLWIKPWFHSNTRHSTLGTIIGGPRALCPIIWSPLQ